jgi:Mn2+/Fe2+ NRAMP family transporter
MPPFLQGIGRRLRIIGPGIAVAATGVGAGDMVAATVSGARYGLAVAWAVVIGALLKYALNEGLARWQLATGTSLLEGWVTHLGRWVQYYFLVYLLFWSLVVGAALVSACGLAAHALMPRWSVETWGILHSLAAALFVLVGRYRLFERCAQVLVGVMFATLIGCALLIAPPRDTLVDTIRMASVPHGSPAFLLGVIGGVGGTLTLLSYGYWIRERGWTSRRQMREVRLDLRVAYLLTGLFGFAVMVLAARVLHAGGVEVAGSEGVLRMAGMLEGPMGAAGRYTFILGFWAAVATSILGVWQSVPYLFCEFVYLLKGGSREDENRIVNTRSPWYRGFLLYLAIPPLGLLYLGKPVALIVLYSVVGALFMPFLAGTLLLMNSRAAWVGRELKYSVVSRVLLVLALALFAYLCVDGIRTAL